MKRVIAGLGVLVFLTGCLQSLHPFFHEADLFFDKRLVGVWVADDETWAIERATSGMFGKRPQNAFAIEVTDKDSTVSHFQGHLGYVGNHAFFDVFPDGTDASGLCVPLHLLHRVWIDADTLRLAVVDVDWFGDSASKAEIKTRLQMREIDGRDFATASTDTLQAFLRDHYRDPAKSHESADVLVRKR